MNRLKLCLVLALSASFSLGYAQKTTAPDDGGLRTLGEEPETGPRRVSRIETMLLHGDYDRLETIATRVRTEKTRAPGGLWVLHTFYEQLNPKENDEQLLAVRRQHLEEWMKQKPESITARVALAEFYTNYAWVARGASEADKVPDSAWPLFQERAKKSEEILHDAIKLTQKCPEWYSALQTVALAEDWDKDRTKKLFEQAVTFESDYPSYYEHYANYLLPKWDGSEKESLDFIQKVSDKRGGEAGDMLYFQIAQVMITRGNAGFRPALEWERLQRGHAALETAYGAAPGEENHFALMAVRFKDAATAQKEFTAIGEKWSRSVWKTRGAFEKARDWAAKNAG